MSPQLYRKGGIHSQVVVFICHSCQVDTLRAGAGRTRPQPRRFAQASDLQKTAYNQSDNPYRQASARLVKRHHYR